MDGVHDLGGKEGFGPIPIDEDDAPFHHDWEGRMWAIAREAGATGKLDFTIDSFRNTLELMVPGDYLTFPYFNKWCTAYMVLFLKDGVFSLDELASGQTTDDPGAAPRRLDVTGALDVTRSSDFSFESPAPAAPAFAVGDRVTTRRHIDATHTRLPQYARAATGTVIAHHGAHVMPDRNVEGTHKGEHLYTVEFPAQELFGPAANALDSVTLDLWESYFVRP
jgi:nitrile hydratase